MERCPTWPKRTSSDSLMVCSISEGKAVKMVMKLVVRGDWHVCRSNAMEEDMVSLQQICQFPRITS